MSLFSKTTVNRLIPLILIFLLILFIALRVWVIWAAFLGQKKYPALGKFAYIANKKLHYIRKGKGPTLLCLHGAYGSVYDFSSTVIDAFAEHFDVIALDRPGQGYSEKIYPQKNFWDHVVALEEFANALGLSKFYLCGHSLGAAVALGYIEKHPEKVSGFLSIGGYVRASEDPLHPLYTVPGIPVLGPLIVDYFLALAGLFLGRTVAADVFWPNPLPESYLKTASALAMQPSAFKNNAQDVRNLSVYLKEISQGYRKIRTPTWIITGDSDLVAPHELHAKLLSEQIQNASLTILSKTGHQPMFVHPEKIVEIALMMKGAVQYNTKP